MRCLLFTFLTLILISCSNDRERRKHVKKGKESITNTYWNVEEIYGNLILLSNDVEVSLIGVEDTPMVESFLKSNLKTKVKITFDSSKKPRRVSNAKTIYAYVMDEDGIDLNGEILKNKVSKLDREFLTDSLFSYKSFASLEYNRNRKTRNGNNELPIQMIQASTFLVENYKGGTKRSEGSGFFIGSNGIGVSNYHVFEGGDNWRIKICEDGSIYKVSRIYSQNENLDFVIFQIDGDKKFEYLELGEVNPKQGDQVFVYGNPKGLTCSLSQGIVSAIRGEDQEFIQIDAAISPGSSGSPVFNREGEVLGIATMKQRDCENCNFAMNIEVILNEIPLNIKYKN